MIRSYRGITLLSIFLIVDCILIWWVNQPRTTGFVTAPIATGDQSIVTLVLVGAAVIAILGAIMFKSKPVPANLRR